MSSQEDAFLGRGWAFPVSFDPARGGAMMLQGEKDIHQSLMILFSTIPGERLMVPGYGCDLNPYVFESLDDTTLTHLRTVISDAILYWEPRIILEDVDFDLGEIAAGRLNITLRYIVEATNSRANLVYPFYLTEGTLANPV